MKLIFLSFIFISLCPLFIIINLSSSMPKGIYLRQFTSISRGDIVAACLDRKFQLIALHHHYLKTGFCDGGAEKIIKRIIAIPGDNVALSNDSIQINGNIYFLPTQYFDRSGNPLFIYPRGTYPHSDGYWLIGSHDLNSWDSRYWGPIQSNQILWKLKPLFIFNNTQ